MRASMFGFVLVTVTACTPLPMTPVHVPQLQIVTPHHMVGHKIPRRLLVVVDPTRVPDDVLIPESEVKEIEVRGLQTFVTRDLARALSAYFESVEIVAPGFEAPRDPHLVADVRIDRLRIRLVRAVSPADPSSQAVQAFGEMTWAFALRLSEDDRYVFSFAATSVGTYSLGHVSHTPQAFQSAFEEAINGLLVEYADKEVHAAIASRSAPRE